MPLEFPLNAIFTETFQGHPLADAAWLTYVSGGNRDRIAQFLTDNSGKNMRGGQLFEKSTYENIPQLVKMFEHIVNRFLFLENADLGDFIDYLFSLAVWFSKPDGPLHNLSATETKRFAYFTEPGSNEYGTLLVRLFDQVQKQFRTVTEGHNKHEFEDLRDAHEFFSKRVLKCKTFLRSEKGKYDRHTVSSLMGYAALKGDKQGYEHEHALIPLLWDKISEVVTFFYTQNRWSQLIQEFDVQYSSGFNLEISYFLHLAARPNERLNMPKDKLTDSTIYAQREYLNKIRDHEPELKSALLTLFAIAGHDYVNSLGNALVQYQAAREDNLQSTLMPFLEKIKDRVFTRGQFNPEAVMDRPNLSYILKFMNVQYQQQMFEEWQGSIGAKLPAQEMLSQLDPPPPEKVNIVFQPSVFLVAAGALGAFLFFR